jgi:ketosteroid isomerase-like protein
MVVPDGCAPRTGPVENRLAAALLLFGSLGIALAGCGRPESAGAEVRDLVGAEVRAINAKDLKSLSGIWAQDDGILMFDVAPPGRFQGWDRIGRQWKDFFERFTDLQLGVDSLRVEVEGNVAYATYDWTLAGTMGPHALQDRGQATAIYRRLDGRWRLVHAHYSPAPPADAAPAAPAAGKASAATAPAAASSSPPPEKPR